MQTHKPPTNANATPRTLYDKQLSNGRTLALNGKAWLTLRAVVLREQPLCDICMREDDRPVMATDVHHIDGNPANNTRENLQPLCHSCHSTLTMAELHGRSISAKGCDVDGLPLDSRHPWRMALNAKKSPATDDDEPHGPLHAQSRESYQP